MPPAARVGDMHSCPMVTPGTPPVPHVGGPILPPGCPTVLIGGMPAARVGDMAMCVGPPDTIAQGSATVMIGGMPAASIVNLLRFKKPAQISDEMLILADMAQKARIQVASFVVQVLLKHMPQKKAVELSSGEDGFKVILEDYTTKKA